MSTTPEHGRRYSPAHMLDPQVLAGLANLELVSRAVVEGFLVGMHRSAEFGFSQEFAEYRPYAEGDDPRMVDWNVYARTDRTYIKRFLGETSSHLMLLLDASASMGFRTGGLSKLDYGKLVAACLAHLASRQHDAVGMMIFDQVLRDFRPPSSRSGRLQGVLHAIDRAHPASGTDMSHPFRQFQEHVRRRGLVAVISDFLCDVEEMMAAVRPLAFQGQDIILFQVLDPGELSPDIRRPTLLEDVETGQAVEVSPSFMDKAYRERIQSHIDELRQAAGAAGADHVLLSTRDTLDRSLRNYLKFRERRR